MGASAMPPPMSVVRPSNDYEEILHAFAIDMGDRIKERRFPPSGHNPGDVSILMDMAFGTWAITVIERIYEYDPTAEAIQRAIGAEARTAAAKVAGIYAVVHSRLAVHIGVRNYRDVPTFAAKLLEAYNACSSQRQY